MKKESKMKRFMTMMALAAAMSVSTAFAQCCPGRAEKKAACKCETCGCTAGVKKADCKCDKCACGKPAPAPAAAAAATGEKKACSK